MNFYHPQYLTEARTLCDEYGILLILDEIATGFGRTGTMFASEHAGIEPDIMCVGKALSAGYLTLAAALTTAEISSVISAGEGGVLMHGPTFMANPLACSAAVASMELLMEMDWKDKINAISQTLHAELLPLRTHPKVKDVRVCGAIGVVETHENVNVAAVQKRFVEMGVWIRPFRNLIYLMPPYITTADQLKQLANAIKEVLNKPI
jgi:adenosylmethionine-8-amino-7-oxononanoate aminotransferase